MPSKYEALLQEPSPSKYSSLLEEPAAATSSRYSSLLEESPEPPPPSTTPASDFVSRAIALAHTPSPQWMQPVENFIKTPLVSAETIVSFAQADQGLPNLQALRQGKVQTSSQPPVIASPVGQGIAQGVGEAASQFTSPGSLALLPLIPEGMAGKAVAAGFTAQGLAQYPELYWQWQRTDDPKEKARILATAATLVAPAAGLLPRGKAPVEKAGTVPAPAEAPPVVENKQFARVESVNERAGAAVPADNPAPAQSTILEGATQPEPKPVVPNPTDAANIWGNMSRQDRWDFLKDSLNPGDLALNRKEFYALTDKGWNDFAKEDWLTNKLINTAEPKPVVPKFDPVIKAAVKDDNGNIYTGTTHGEAISKVPSGINVSDQNAEGFVTQSGQFLTGSEAYQKAVEQGQIEGPARKALDASLLNIANRKRARIVGPALIDPEGNIVAQGKIGDSHATLLAEASRTDQADAVLQAFENDNQHAFVDENGNVLNRQQAAGVAVANGQASEGTTELQSQDLTQPTTEQPTEPAAAQPEPEPASPQETPVSGINNERLYQIYGKDAVVSGKGHGPKALQEMGRADTRDPYQVLSNAQRNGIATGADVAKLRDEHNRLLDVARNSYGTQQYPELAQRAVDMANAIKGVAHGPASEVFRALQEADIPRYTSPADFDNIVRERMQRESTPDEQAAFKKVTDEVNNGDREAVQAATNARTLLRKSRLRAAKEPMQFEDAADYIRKQIADLTKDCVV